MTALFWIVGILLLLIVLALPRLRFEIRYDGAVSFMLSYLFFKIKFPLKKDPEKQARKVEKEKKKRSKKRKTKRKKEKEQPPQDEKSFREKVNSVLTLLNDLFGFSKRLLHYMKKKFLCEKLQVAVGIGTGDAAMTAISVGGLWGFLYTAYAAVSQYFSVTFEQPEFNVTPDYNQKKFDFQFHGIFSVRVVNIIVIGLWSLGHFIKSALKIMLKSRAQDAAQAKTIEK